MLSAMRRILSHLASPAPPPPPPYPHSIKKSNAAGEQLKEAQAINKSLSALGNVISALATENPHVPYRDHKLTMIMSDSLGGTAKTLMFVNCSPAEYNVDETQNSLNYALRVGKIKVRERAQAGVGSRRRRKQHQMVGSNRFQGTHDLGLSDVNSSLPAGPLLRKSVMILGPCRTLR